MGIFLHLEASMDLFLFVRMSNLEIIKELLKDLEGA